MESSPNPQLRTSQIQFNFTSLATLSMPSLGLNRPNKPRPIRVDVESPVKRSTRPPPIRIDIELTIPKTHDFSSESSRTPTCSDPSPQESTRPTSEESETPLQPEPTLGPTGIPIHPFRIFDRAYPENIADAFETISHRFRQATNLSPDISNVLLQKASVCTYLAYCGIDKPADFVISSYLFTLVEDYAEYIKRRRQDKKASISIRAYYEGQRQRIEAELFPDELVVMFAELSDEELRDVVDGVCSGATSEEQVKVMDCLQSVLQSFERSKAVPLEIRITQTTKQHCERRRPPQPLDTVQGWQETKRSIVKMQETKKHDHSVTQQPVQKEINMGQDRAGDGVEGIKQSVSAGSMERRCEWSYYSKASSLRRQPSVDDLRQAVRWTLDMLFIGEELEEEPAECGVDIDELL